MGNLPGKNCNRIVCADTCDYRPFPKHYGNCFLPLAKVGVDEEYFETKDYKEKSRVLDLSYSSFRK